MLLGKFIILFLISSCDLDIRSKNGLLFLVEQTKYFYNSINGGARVVLYYIIVYWFDSGTEINYSCLGGVLLFTGWLTDSPRSFISSS